jgi:hypothetical protein
MTKKLKLNKLKSKSSKNKFNKLLKQVGGKNTKIKNKKNKNNRNSKKYFNKKKNKGKRVFKLVGGSNNTQLTLINVKLVLDKLDTAFSSGTFEYKYNTHSMNAAYINISEILKNEIIKQVPNLFEIKYSIEDLNTFINSGYFKNLLNVYCYILRLQKIRFDIETNEVFSKNDPINLKKNSLSLNIKIYNLFRKVSNKLFERNDEIVMDDKPIDKIVLDQILTSIINNNNITDNDELEIEYFKSTKSKYPIIVLLLYMLYLKNKIITNTNTKDNCLKIIIFKINKQDEIETDGFINLIHTLLSGENLMIYIICNEDINRNIFNKRLLTKFVHEPDIMNTVNRIIFIIVHGNFLPIFLNVIYTQYETYNIETLITSDILYNVKDKKDIVYIDSDITNIIIAENNGFSTIKYDTHITSDKTLQSELSQFIKGAKLKPYMIKNLTQINERLKRYNDNLQKKLLKIPVQQNSKQQAVYAQQNSKQHYTYYILSEQIKILNDNIKLINEAVETNNLISFIDTIFNKNMYTLTEFLFMVESDLLKTYIYIYINTLNASSETIKHKQLVKKQLVKKQLVKKLSLIEKEPNDIDLKQENILIRLDQINGAKSCITMSISLLKIMEYIDSQYNHRYEQITNNGKCKNFKHALILWQFYKFYLYNKKLTDSESTPLKIIVFNLNYITNQLDATFHNSEKILTESHFFNKYVDVLFNLLNKHENVIIYIISDNEKIQVTNILQKKLFLLKRFLISKIIKNKNLNNNYNKYLHILYRIFILDSVDMDKTKTKLNIIYEKHREYDLEDVVRIRPHYLFRLPSDILEKHVLYKVQTENDLIYINKIVSDANKFTTIIWDIHNNINSPQLERAISNAISVGQ